MTNKFPSHESIELLIIKQVNSNNEQIERIYVKKSDMDTFVSDIMNRNPFMQALKFIVASVLLTFVATLVSLVYASYSTHGG